jgi:hypothetical protein
MLITEERCREMVDQADVVSGAIERRKYECVEAGDVARAAKLGALAAGAKAYVRKTIKMHRKELA